MTDNDRTLLEDATRAAKRIGFPGAVIVGRDGYVRLTPAQYKDHMEHAFRRGFVEGRRELFASVAEIGRSMKEQG